MRNAKAKIALNNMKQKINQNARKSKKPKFDYYYYFHRNNRNNKSNNNYYYYYNYRITIIIIIITIVSLSALSAENISAITTFSQQQLDSTFNLTSNNNNNQNNIIANRNNDNSDPGNGVVIPAILVSILLFATIGYLAYDHFVRGANRVREPEQQFNLILCHEDNVQHEYNMIFRVGAPSHDFDMRNGFIEFVILGPGDEPIGCPVRFDCSLLPDPCVCAEMHCLIGHITRMPRVSGIRAYHGDHVGTIFLYEYVLFDLADDRVIELRRFYVYLSNQPAATYRGTSLSADDIDAAMASIDLPPGANLLSESRIARSASNNSTSTAAVATVAAAAAAEAVAVAAEKIAGKQCPELPLMEWNDSEFAIFSLYAIMLAGAIVMIFEYCDTAYPVNQEQIGGSLNRSLFDVLYGTVICLPLFATFALVYLYFVKKKTLRDELRMIGQPNPSFIWRYACYLYLGFIVLFVLILAFIIVYLGTKIVQVKSWYWFASTLIVSVIMFGAWSAANQSLWFKSFFERKSTAAFAAAFARGGNSGSGGISTSAGNGPSGGTDQLSPGNNILDVDPDETVFFSNPLERKNKRAGTGGGATGSQQQKQKLLQTQHPESSGMMSSFGPKLKNPIKLMRSVSKKRLKRTEEAKEVKEVEEIDKLIKIYTVQANKAKSCKFGNNNNNNNASLTKRSCTKKQNSKKIRQKSRKTRNATKKKLRNRQVLSQAKSISKSKNKRNSSRRNKSLFRRNQKAKGKGIEGGAEEREGGGGAREKKGNKSCSGKKGGAGGSVRKKKRLKTKTTKSPSNKSGKRKSRQKKLKKLRKS